MWGLWGLCHTFLKDACSISARLGARGVAGSPKKTSAWPRPSSQQRLETPWVFLHTQTLWLGTVGSVMPYLLSQYLRILLDGHHLHTKRATSQSSLIYWWDLSHSVWKTAPTKIPLLGKRQLKSQYKQSAHLESACTFPMPHSWKQSHTAWHDNLCGCWKGSPAHRTVMQSWSMLNSWLKRVSECFSVQSLPPWRCLLCSLCFPSISFLATSHH